MEIIARTSDWSSITRMRGIAGSRMLSKPAYDGACDLGQTRGHYSTCE
jgi:hypothetical protein